MENFFKNIPVLKTKHYILRGIQVGDAPGLFEIMGDADTMKYITPHPVSSLDQMEETIARRLKNFRDKTEIPWVLLQKEESKLIGFVRLHKIHLWHRKAEIGASIHKNYQRTGVMTELMPVLLKFAFEELNLNRLAGDIFADNEGSRKLLEKYGFQMDGLMRETDYDGEKYHDTIVYSMLKREYIE